MKQVNGIDRRTRAIAMWDFSWLERRWPGGGYEDPRDALHQLRERGYDTVRIDPFPHLRSADPAAAYDLIPCWTEPDWGSPGRLRTAVEPHLTEFIRICDELEIDVALSSWFRHDTQAHRMNILSPEGLARVWIDVLDHLDAEGLLDRIYYVDLCNEWPQEMWAPFFDGDRGNGDDWRTDSSMDWMKRAIGAVRSRYPDIPLCFSFSGHYLDGAGIDLSFFDLLEPHIWMTSLTNFYQRIGVGDTKFDPQGLERIAWRAEALYRVDPHHFQAALRQAIRRVAAWSEEQGLPLVTTECWAIIDYKDGPMFSWDWIRELSDVAITEAIATQRWSALATSNFCGPQFPGMWREVDWHRDITARIRASAGPGGPRVHR